MGVGHLFSDVLCVGRDRLRRMQQVRPRRRLTGWKRRRVRVVTGGANLAVDRAQFALPVAAGPPVHACFPIPISRPMTTAAKRGTFYNLQVAAITGLERFEVVLIVAVEAIVVAVVPPVGHDDVLVLLWNNHVSLVVQFELR